MRVVEDKKIIISISEWKYKILLKKIDALKTGMRMFKINDGFKKVFMDDLYSIETIIKKHGGGAHEMVRSSDK